MRILVTGGTGFIGRHAVRALAAEGHEVISASRAATGPAEAAWHIQHDFAQPAGFPDVGGLGAVVHLAGNGNAQASWKRMADVAQVNTQGTLHAIEIAARSQAVFVLASSQRVYQTSPNPLNEEAPTAPPDPYGYTKLAAELYVTMAGRLFGLRGGILRLFSVYGPGQVVEGGLSGVVAILGQRAIEGKPLVVMSHQRKDFIDVSDAVGAIRLALARPSSPPQTYNIATGVPTTVYELASAIRVAAGSTSEIVEDYREGDPGALVADIGRARSELGFEPRIPLKEGLRRYVDWLVSARTHPA